jgi:hypothetical protein
MVPNILRVVQWRRVGQRDGEKMFGLYYHDLNNSYLLLRSETWFSGGMQGSRIGLPTSITHLPKLQEEFKRI